MHANAGAPWTSGEGLQSENRSSTMPSDTYQIADQMGDGVENLGSLSGQMDAGVKPGGREEADLAALYYQLKNSGLDDGSASRGRGPLPGPGNYSQIPPMEYGSVMNDPRLLYGNGGRDPYDAMGAGKRIEPGNMMPDGRMMGAVRSDVNPGMPMAHSMYHASPRPSLRSQREALANLAKQMPKVTGVHFEKKSPAWVANWKEQGMKKRIWFRVSEHGMVRAHLRAVEARRSAEIQLPKKDRASRKERRRPSEQDAYDRMKNMATTAPSPMMNIDPSLDHTYPIEPPSVTPEFSNNQDKSGRQERVQAQVYYDTVTHSWVTSWTTPTFSRARRFSTKEHGFDRAYCLAVQRKHRPMIIPDEPDVIRIDNVEGVSGQGRPPAWSHEVKGDENPEHLRNGDGGGVEGHPPADKGANAPVLTLEDCQALTTECLTDLRDRVIPRLAHQGQHQPGQHPEVMIQYHLNAVQAATTEHELRPYVTLFNESLTNKQLPSATSLEAQQSMLHTLSLLMTLTRLLKEHTDGSAADAPEGGGVMPEVSGTS